MIISVFVEKSYQLVTDKFKSLTCHGSEHQRNPPSDLLRWKNAGKLVELDCCHLPRQSSRCLTPARGQNMAAALFQLLCLLLPLFVAGQLDQVDKVCEGDIPCQAQDKCETFTKAKEDWSNLSKDSCEWREAFNEIKSSVCNKAQKGVCCKPCGLGQVCTPQNECPDFLEEKEKLGGLGRRSPERAALLQRIQRRICSKTDQTVCCDRTDSKCNSCDPAQGSCLPTYTEGEEKPTCGFTGNEHRVVGGTNALPGEFPFTALLGQKRTRKGLRGVMYEEKKFTCGGTLINLRYVLTAAHCQQRRKQLNLVRLGEFEVTDFKSRDCSSGFCLEDPQDFDIRPEDVIRHPDYNRVRQDHQDQVTNTINDIALIRLPRQARKNLAVKVVCLPLQPDIAAEQLNVPDINEGLASYYPTAVGWGYTEADPYKQQHEGTKERVPTKIQQKLAIPVLSTDQCRRKLFDFIPRSDQICAGGEEGKDTCGVSFIC